MITVGMSECPNIRVSPRGGYDVKGVIDKGIVKWQLIIKYP